MGKDAGSWRSSAFVVPILCMVLSGACGGGGSGVRVPDPAGPILTLVTPAVFYTSTRLTFTVHGADLGAQGDDVTVRFTATAGTPFEGGTSTTADVTAVVESSTTLEGLSPPDVTAGQVVSSVTCTWPGGATYTLPNAVVFREYSKLFASDARPFDYTGSSVAVSNETILVGSPRSGDLDSGAAYVFKRAGAVWTEAQKLTGSEVGPGDRFGRAVTISGNTAAVGAPLDAESGADTGAVYVFVRSGGVWSEQAVIRSPEIEREGDFFGISVSLDGDTLLVGAVFQGPGPGAGPGAAYVFERNGRFWNFQGKLAAPDGAGVDEFGASVGVSGDLAVVGAPVVDVRTGAAYVFRRRNTTWSFERRLDATDGAQGHEFARAVALSGDVLVAGARLNDVPGPGIGAAYVYRRGNGSWQDSVRLPAAIGYNFGSGVSVSGERVLVGGRESGGYGRCELWVYDGELWHRQGVLTPPDRPGVNSFGDAVGLSPSTVVVGAAQDRTKGEAAGAAYGF